MELYDSRSTSQNVGVITNQIHTTEECRHGMQNNDKSMNCYAVLKRLQHKMSQIVKNITAEIKRF